MPISIHDRRPDLQTAPQLSGYKAVSAFCRLDTGDHDQGLRVSIPFFIIGSSLCALSQPFIAVFISYTTLEPDRSTLCMALRLPVSSILVRYSEINFNGK